MKDKRERVERVEILVVTIILGVLGWLSKTVFQMKGTLSAVKEHSLLTAQHVDQMGSTLSGVKEQASLTNQRVDQIVKVLQRLSIHIAWEEVNGPFLTAVVMSKPLKRSRNIWVRNLYIIDAKNNRMIIFKVPRNSRDELQKLDDAIRGVVYKVEPTAVTFAQLKNWSYEIKQPTVMPSHLDENMSFILRSKKADQFMRFVSLWLKQEPRITRNFNKKINSWQELIKKLYENPIAPADSVTRHR